MTKKHFVMLARAIREHNFNVLNNRPAKSTYSPYGNQFDANQLETIADFCQSQNAQFDRERFLSACGIAQPVPVRNGTFTVKHTTRDVWGVDDND